MQHSRRVKTISIFVLRHNEKLASYSAIFYRVQCALFYIENDAGIFSVPLYMEGS
jgi:hypothetical protein